MRRATERLARRARGALVSMAKWNDDLRPVLCQWRRASRSVTLFAHSPSMMASIMWYQNRRAERGPIAHQAMISPRE